VNDKVKKQRKALTMKQFMSCIEEVYIHALQKGKNMDDSYVDWFIDLLEGLKKRFVTPKLLFCSPYAPRK
jgi:hypothetical protein